MKIILSIIFLIHLDRANVCNTDLLESYGIKSPQYTQNPQMLCGGEEAETCCSQRDENEVLY